MVVYKYVNIYWATPMTTKPSRRRLQNSSPGSWVAKEKDLQTLMFGALQRCGWVSLTYLQQNLCVCVAQSCLTLCSPLDCSLPGSSIHWILHARTLEWVAIPFSRESFWSNSASHTAGRFFTIWATREAPTIELICLQTSLLSRALQKLSVPHWNKNSQPKTPTIWEKLLL